MRSGDYVSSRMNGYNFTDRVRKVLQMAREEAARLHHEYVGTEHLLLGLIREGEGVALAVLTNLKVDLQEIRRQVEELAPARSAAADTGPDLPYTSRAKKVLELAMSEARELRHSFVGSEHLLLGMLRERTGVAAQVLTKAGVSLEQARAETIRLLSTTEYGQARPRRGVGPGISIRVSRLLVVGGIVFTLSGVEAFWYGPNLLGKAIGMLGAFGGVLLLLVWVWLRPR